MSIHDLIQKSIQNYPNPKMKENVYFQSDVKSSIITPQGIKTKEIFEENRNGNYLKMVKDNGKITKMIRGKTPTRKIRFTNKKSPSNKRIRRTLTPYTNKRRQTQRLRTM